MLNKVLIIILTLNEEPTIGNLIDQLKINFKDADILVIDGYSKDKTSEIVIKKKAEIIFIDKYFGIGLGVEAGIYKANIEDYDLLIRLDGDGQHLVEDVAKLAEQVVIDKTDLAIGSRFHQNASYKPSFNRLIGINILLLKRKSNIFVLPIIFISFSFLWSSKNSYLIVRSIASCKSTGGTKPVSAIADS
jgi:glycosyltransferase involved in cell wall biosynthesis